MCLFPFFWSGGRGEGRRNRRGPAPGEGRGAQQKAVSRPARSFTPPPPCPGTGSRTQLCLARGAQGGRAQEDLSPEPLLTPSPRTRWATRETHSSGREGAEEALRGPGQVSGAPRPSHPHGPQGARPGPGSRELRRRPAPAPRPAPTLRELQLQLRQLRPHLGRQRRRSGRRGLQASLRHPGSASHTPEDTRGGRRRDGLTRTHTPATESGSGRREPPTPPPPPPWQGSRDSGGPAPRPRAPRLRSPTRWGLAGLRRPLLSASWNDEPKRGTRILRRGTGSSGGCQLWTSSVYFLRTHKQGVFGGRTLLFSSSLHLGICAFLSSLP